MMKKHYLFLSMIFAFLVLTISCKDDPAAPINEAQVLVEYLESANSPLGKDYVASDMPSIISATDLNSANLLGTVYIVDIRSATDFATGHITNAHNVALADIFTHLQGVTNLSTYEKIAVVCYTGQTAGFATSLLRTMGYANAFSLKWGMSSWSATFDKWTANLGNGGASQFNSTAVDKGVKGELPVLSTGKTTGEEILTARVADVLTAGFDAAKITSATVLANPGNYYIINYWPSTHYTDPGHLTGAMQYTPKESMKLLADLKTLPNNKTIVVYCYTGQTSAFLVAYLRILGYDAKSLLFGTNGMIYDKMGTFNTANPNGKMTVFSASEIKGYTYTSK